MEWGFQPWPGGTVEGIAPLLTNPQPQWSHLQALGCWREPVLRVVLPPGKIPCSTLPSGILLLLSHIFCLCWPLPFAPMHTTPSLTFRKRYFDPSVSSFFSPLPSQAGLSREQLLPSMSPQRVFPTIHLSHPRGPPSVGLMGLHLLQTSLLASKT